MRILGLLFFFLTTTLIPVSGSSHPVPPPTEPDALKVVVNVKVVTDDYAVLVVEEVLDFGRHVRASVQTGDELTVINPGRYSPRERSRIVVTLREKLTLGAVNSTFIILAFQQATDK
jgi:hypothetical protein